MGLQELRPHHHPQLGALGSVSSPRQGKELSQGRGPSRGSRQELEETGPGTGLETRPRHGTKGPIQGTGPEAWMGQAVVSLGQGLTALGS